VPSDLVASVNIIHKHNYTFKSSFIYIYIDFIMLPLVRKTTANILGFGMHIPELLTQRKFVSDQNCG